MRETTHRAVRLALASLITVALAAQLLIGMSEGGLTVVNFFSYFTVLSNTASVVLLSILAFSPDADSTIGFALFRGAVTVYMAVTGLVYAVILAPNLADVAVPEPWIDWVIHVIGPLGVIADWFFDKPPLRLPRHSFWVWLGFPVAYVTYSLIRGPIAEWYPYPFLDPAEQGGYGGVAVMSAIVLVVIVAFSGLFYWWANREPSTKAA